MNARVQLLVVLLVASSAAAHGGEVVSDPIVIWDDADDALTEDVVYNPVHNEYLVLFENSHHPGGDVYARRVAEDGTVLSWFSVYAAPGERNYQARAAYSPAQDEYLVAWTREQSTGTEDDILARTVAWDGSSMGTVFTLAGAVDPQREPDVAYNGNADEYLVVYHNEWAGGARDVAAQRIKASDGSLLSWAIVATGSTTWPRSHAEVAFNPITNTYFIVYHSDQIRIYGKVAAADLAGVSVAPEIIVYDMALFIAENLGLAASPDDYLIGWLEYDPGPGSEYWMMARLVSASGLPLGPTAMLLDSGMMGLEYLASASASFGHWGHYLVAWDASLGYSPVRFVAVRTQAGGPAGPVVAVDGAGNGFGPSLACPPAGACLLAYSDDYSPSTAGECDVVGRLIAPVVFASSFEGGDTLAWSVTVP